MTTTPKSPTTASNGYPNPAAAALRPMQKTHKKRKVHARDALCRSPESTPMTVLSTRVDLEGINACC